MLGELGHIDGSGRRMRFAFGCCVAALILPPWGRAAAGAWAMIGLAATSLGLYAGLSVGYRLGLVQLLYANVAVAILGGGGPPDQDGGFTVRGTVSDRLIGNNIQLLVSTLLIAMVGWAAAALAGHLVRRTPAPTGALGTDGVREA